MALLSDNKKSTAKKAINNRSQPAKATPKQTAAQRRAVVKKQLVQLGKGGNVDLTNRPVVSASKLKAAGWKNAGTGKATVFSSTYSNASGNKAANFTPIVASGSKLKRILGPAELQSYGEGVLAGRRKDTLKIQMGPIHKGKQAIKSAVDAAILIHKLHEEYFL